MSYEWIKERRQGREEGKKEKSIAWLPIKQTGETRVKQNIHIKKVDLKDR